MGDFRLKPGIKVEYNADTYKFKFHGVDLNHKKLTSRAFPTILGQNKWESVGSCILERYKALEKEQIDPYYMVRGDLAEILVFNYMKDFYKKNLNVDLDLRTWDKQAVSYDNFKNNEMFGGLLDIAIAGPEKHRAVIEVKSKSLKDIDIIRKSKGNPEEVMQGLFLTEMSKETKCLMVYVFFTPDQEQAIKQVVTRNKGADSRKLAEQIIKDLRLTHEQCDIEIFKYLTTDYEMETKMKVAWNNLALFKKTTEIAETYFSESEVLYLQQLAGIEIKEKPLF